VSPSSRSLDALSLDSLSLDDLDARSAEYDAAVARSPLTDRFCASSDWALPAARGLLPGGAPFIRALDGGWLALRVREEHGVPVAEPLESMWGLGCPLVGEQPARLALEAARTIEAGLAGVPVLISGLPPRGPLLEAVAGALAPARRLYLGPSTVRRVASLEGGVDGFLARRGSHLRKNLKRAQRRATARGLRIVTVDADALTAPALYDRLVAVEALSWKGQEGVGIAASSMVDFYRLMVPRLARRGALRAAVALDAQGRDCGMLFGGLFGDTFRGLQFCYSADYADCSLGNLLQLHAITQLCDEKICWYDLGTESDYKSAWGELRSETVILLARPR
jgi:hypothetical protein